jgi:hypothetical protein
MRGGIRAQFGVRMILLQDLGRRIVNPNVIADLCQHGGTVEDIAMAVDLIHKLEVTK